MDMEVSSKVGRAHGFMQTGSSASRIREAFGRMKADPEAKVPGDLELIVGRAPDDRPFQAFQIAVLLFENPASDESKLFDMLSQIFRVSDRNDLHRLLQISVDMEKEGANCIVQAALPNATNEKTAAELGHVFNLTYSCTEIMMVDGNENPVATDIYFKNENGIYVSKRPRPSEAPV